MTRLNLEKPKSEHSKKLNPLDKYCIISNNDADELD